MRDVELYRALLGLMAPWTVAGVEVDMPGQRVVVRWRPAQGRIRVRSAARRLAGMTEAPSVAPSRIDAVHDLD